jgi:hypothetical protein
MVGWARRSQDLIWKVFVLVGFGCLVLKTNAKRANVVAQSWALGLLRALMTRGLGF